MDVVRNTYWVITTPIDGITCATEGVSSLTMAEITVGSIGRSAHPHYSVTMVTRLISSSVSYVTGTVNPLLLPTVKLSPQHGESYLTCTSKTSLNWSLDIGTDQMLTRRAVFHDKYQVNCNCVLAWPPNWILVGLVILRAAFKFGRRVNFALRRKMLNPPIARLPAI